MEGKLEGTFSIREKMKYSIQHFVSERAGDKDISYYVSLFHCFKF